MRRNRKYMAVCTAAVMTFSLTAGMTAMAGSDKAFSIDMTDTSEGSWAGLAMANDDTVSTGANIRSAADENGTVVGFLYRGGAVEVVNKGDTWTEIKSGDVTGYIKNEYLTYGDEAKGLAEYYGVEGVETSWNDVNVFSNADADASIVHTAGDGEAYPVVEDQGHWLSVQLGADNMAYVSEEDVARVLLVDEAVPLNGDSTAADSVSAESYEAPAEEAVSDDSYVDESYTDTTASDESYTDESYTDESYTDESYTDENYSDESYDDGTTSDESYSDESYTDDSYAEDVYTDETVSDETYTDDVYTDGTSDDTSYDDGTSEDVESADGAEEYTDDSVEYTEDTSYDTSADTYTEETEAYVEETESTTTASGSDLDLMAAIIYCEAGNQSYDGMVAVGAVIMNRVASSSFPGSISDVIYQSGQFTPASSGALASALASGVPSSCYDAASAALAGENPVGGALYFNTGSGKGIQIGAHQFY